MRYARSAATLLFCLWGSSGFAAEGDPRYSEAMKSSDVT
jgi:hypothetical protein